MEFVPETATNKREFTGLLGWVVRGFSFAFGAFCILSIAFGPLPDMEQKAVFAFFGFSLIFINLMPIKRGKPETRVPWWDVVLIGIVVVVTVNMFINWNHYIVGVMSIGPYEFIVGIASALIVMEVTRRSLGWILPGLTLAALAYIYIAPYLPGIWSLNPMRLDYIVLSTTIINQGMWGFLTGLGARMIAVYIVFGSILLVTGGGQTFTDIGLMLAGRIRGGPALVSVVASAGFGTVSGSAVANVLVDGNFTIPLMKRLGYRAEFASAVEATASMGGQFTPPILGASAFLMAELLEMSYIKIAIAAILPAFLYYTLLFFTILLEARKRGLARVPEEEIPRLRSTLTWPKLAPLIIPVAILLWRIGEGIAVERACVAAILASLFLYFFALSTDFSWSAIKRRLGTVFNAVETGGRSLCELVGLIMCANLVVGLMNQSGMAIKLSTVIMLLAEKNLLVALIMGGVLCIILGMGLPAIGAYVLVVSVVGMGFVRMGLDPLAMHMFAFYLGCVALITPPFCPACYVAAAIGKTDWLKVGFEACRLGMVAFIVPFTFVYNPVYLMKGEPIDIIIGVVLGVVGSFFIACATIGYLRAPINILSRLLLFCGGFMLFLPGIKTDIMGALCVAAGFLIMMAPQLIRRLIAR